MNLPDLNEARKRTNSETEYIYLEDNYEKSFINKKYFIKTYGCQMNVHDSEEIAARLESLGYVKTDDYLVADIILLNTCAIRENAHDKVFGFLGRCKHLKKDRPDILVGLCGCMAQEESIVSEIRAKLPYVDLVFGTHNINELQEMIIKRQQELDSDQDIKVYSCEGKVFENISYKRDSDIKAWVNIQYGCDKFCTYCIVPFTRGKQRSRKSIDIINEVKELVDAGYQEVTLLGQNVNAYGKDLVDEIGFAGLLESAAKTNIPRIRFVTSHPWDFTDEVIDVIAKYDNIMPYIHLPLQSGSDAVLKRMGRRYTSEEYLTLFNKIKSKVKNVSITTDIIVGFPDETEIDFSHTMELVNECQFDGAFTFIYSPREGTPAAKMSDSISLEDKEIRLYELNKVVNKYAKIKNEKLVGSVVPVLIEGLSEKDDTKLFGYTDTMKLVNIKGDKSYIGKIVDVLILEAKSFSLNGEIK